MAAGHFEKGVWIEDKPRPTIGVVEVHIQVDDSELIAARDRVQTLIRDIERAAELLNWIEYLTVRLECNKYPRGFWQRLRWLITGKVK